MEGLFRLSEEKDAVCFVKEVWQNNILKTRKLSFQVLFFFEDSYALFGRTIRAPPVEVILFISANMSLKSVVLHHWREKIV
jgi:hypothetical protein